MVPTELMAAAVAMLTDAFPQFLHVGNELFTCHLVKVGVYHRSQPRQWTTEPPSTAMVCPVMKSLSSEARKTRVPTRSAGT